jgi:hypothetical protein
VLQPSTVMLVVAFLLLLRNVARDVVVAVRRAQAGPLGEAGEGREAEAEGERALQAPPRRSATAPAELSPPPPQAEWDEVRGQGSTLQPC